jgi:hypothetical protein
VVLKNKGRRQSPITSNKINRKIRAEVIAASRGKRMARPLQVQDKLRHWISRTSLTGYHEEQQDHEEKLILR